MNIGIIIEEKLAAGGGYNQSFNTLGSIMKSIDKSSDQVYLYTNFLQESENLLYDNVTIIHKKKSIFDYIYLYFSQSLFFSFSELFFKRNFISCYEKKLKKEKIDLILFLSPTSLSPLLISKIPFVIVVWDNSHRDYSEFPEVNGNVFRTREMLLNYSLPRALFIISDSKELSLKLSSRYGVDIEKFLEIPFFISPFLREIDHQLNNKLAIKSLLPNQYIFYPAQYWAHKNHIIILKAINYLKIVGIEINVVFCGADYGIKSLLLKYVKINNMISNVTFLNFVTNDELSYLYQNANAVIMTTYFGPTNIPPLEAWYYKKPLIYSKHLGDHSINSAILVDVDDYKDVANGIQNSFNQKICDEIVSNGHNKLSDIQKQIFEQEQILSNKFERFRNRITK